MAHKFTLNRPTEERLDIFLDGECVGAYNHDAHGWQGMEDAEALVRQIAKKLDVEVEETET